MATFGSTSTGIVLNSATQNPATITSGAYVTNTTAAFNADAVFGYAPTAWTVSNYGTVRTTGTHSDAVYLDAGGNVTNGAGGLIENNWLTVDFNNAAGTVQNFGTIENGETAPVGGFRGAGVFLPAGGLLINGAPDAATALITASYGDTVCTGVLRGVSQPGAIGTVINYGTIQSAGTGGAAILLDAGGAVTNHGTIEHVGNGTSGEAVYLGAGGVVTNDGLLDGAAAGNATSGYPGVIVARNAPATVVNFGTIANPNNSDGINLLQGGLLVNGATLDTSATIYAPRAGVYMGGKLGTPYPGALGTVINYGTITNASKLADAVRLVSGGSVLNRGLISTPRTGIAFVGSVAGTVNNFGTILDTPPTAYARGAGVYMQAGGVMTNQAGALILSTKTAVDFNDTSGTIPSIGTLTNFGTIDSTGTNSSVVLAEGGTVANAEGGQIAAQSNGISLSGTTNAAATVSNAGIVVGNIGVDIGAADTGANTIVNYGTIVGTSGTAVALGAAGNEALVIAAGSTLGGVIAGMQPGDTIDLPFLTFATAGTIAAGADNVLTVTEGAASYALHLDPNQNFADDVFALSADLTSGTLVTELASPPPPPVTGTVVSAGEVLFVSGGQTGSGIIVENGGTLVVLAGGVAASTRVESGGMAIVSAGGVASATDIDGGTLQLLAGATASGGIDFVALGGGGQLQLGGSETATSLGLIGSLDTLDLTNLAYGSADTVSIGAGNLLQVTAGGTTDGVQLDPEQNFADDGFQLASDTASGTLVGLVPEVFFTAGEAGAGVARAEASAAGNSDTGYWSFDAGGDVSGFDNLGAGASSYTPVATGDFDGSGQPEVLWQNAATGDTGYWTTSGGVVTGFNDLGTANTSYTLVGVGDFAGSGHDEVLWEDAATSDTGYWLAGAGGPATGFNDLGAGAAGYAIVGIGDFDASGHAEVLWENAATGNTGYWTAGTTGAATGFADLGTAASGYSVVGVGDFDGSGHDEVLWEDANTGDIGYWTTSGGAVTGFHDFGFANTAYSVIGVGDYDGSGHDEVLWEDPTTGDTGYWTTNAQGQVAGFHDLTAADTAFHVVAPAAS